MHRRDARACVSRESILPFLNGEHVYCTISSKMAFTYTGSCASYHNKLLKTMTLLSLFGHIEERRPDEASGWALPCANEGQVVGQWARAKLTGHGRFP